MTGSRRWVVLLSAAAALVLGAAQELECQTRSGAGDPGGDADPFRRSQQELSQAESAFSEARDAYREGKIKDGDQHLDEMIKRLNTCVAALEAAHKSRYYKQAEIRVAGLMRRLKTILEDLSVDDRGWAEYTSHQIEEIHDKLLSGVMKK
jgi:hypothetical protein